VSPVAFEEPNMKKPLSLGVVSLFLGVSAISALTRSGSQERAANQRIQDRFIGAWRLAWLEEPDPDGNLHKVDCSGLLVYTPDGHMSVQVMFRNPQSRTKAAPVPYAQGGYEASFGTYQINENAHTSLFTSRAHWYGVLPGKTFRGYSSFPAISLSSSPPTRMSTGESPGNITRGAERRREQCHTL